MGDEKRKLRHLTAEIDDALDMLLETYTREEINAKLDAMTSDTAGKIAVVEGKVSSCQSDIYGLQEAVNSIRKRTDLTGFKNFTRINDKITLSKPYTDFKEIHITSGRNSAEEGYTYTIIPTAFFTSSVSLLIKLVGDKEIVIRPNNYTEIEIIRLNLEASDYGIRQIWGVT